MKNVRAGISSCLLEALESRVLLSAAAWQAVCIPLDIPSATASSSVLRPAPGASDEAPMPADVLAVDAGGPAPKGPGGTVSVSLTANVLGPKAVYLNWSASGGSIAGFYLYRSGDGGNTFTRIGTLGASTRNSADLNAVANTAYIYKIVAYGKNAATLASASTSATTPADGALTPGGAVNVTTRYGNELVIAGTAGVDNIEVSQVGSTLNIIANGVTSTASAPANGLFIYSFGSADTITVDASVTLRLTIASIDGAVTSISNGDPTAEIWMDATDLYTGVLPASGGIHNVGSFYEGVSKTVGINIKEPTDAGTTFRAGGSLWGAKPVMDDVNQDGIGDCYFLGSLAAFANSCPTKLQDWAVDLGDGTYAVQYLRGSTPTYVRVDGDMPLGPYDGYYGAMPGASGDLWAMVLEKSYAYFRYGQNSYNSLNGGWMTDVYSDFGVANSNVQINTKEMTFYNAVSTALTNHKPVTLATYSQRTTLVSNHVYTLVSTSISGGKTYYRVRNPWGVAGDSLEDAYGYATLTYSQVVSNFQVCTMAT